MPHRPYLVWLTTLVLVASFAVPTQAFEATASAQGAPLLNIGDLTYDGAFRLELGTFGASGSGYGAGVIGAHSDGGSLFVVSNPQVSAIAEYPRVNPSMANSLEELPIAGPPLQNFTTVVDRPPTGNPQALDRIGGLLELDGSLIVNGYEYYDAPADNTHTTLALTDASDLANSPVNGWAEMSGEAHASGWLSPIPAEWQAQLGGTHISGNSSGVPINGRSSMGPSAFAVDLDATLAGVGSATALLDFDLESPLDDDLSNDSLTNELWTHLSRAVYGMIVPGTSTYLTLGHSGGHASGVSYGVPPWGGYSGYYPNDRNDLAPYYWLWDVEDLAAVRAGNLSASAVRPYAAGTFDVPFATLDSRLAGASWDPGTERLLMALTYTDTTQSVYEEAPLILSYAIEVHDDGLPPEPDPTEVMHTVSCLAGRGRVDTNIVNSTGAAATYRIEFEGLSPREWSVEPGDWWRMPVTGRFDGNWQLTVLRDGQTISDTTVDISCSDANPAVTDDQVRIVNACRNGLGYILFQFANSSAASQGFVIEFDNVPNRSTSAAAFGQSIRAVTGRPPGTYSTQVRSGGAIVSSEDVVVNCSG